MVMSTCGADRPPLSCLPQERCPAADPEQSPLGAAAAHLRAPHCPHGAAEPGGGAGPGGAGPGALVTAGREPSCPGDGAAAGRAHCHLR